MSVLSSRRALSLSSFRRTNTRTAMVKLSGTKNHGTKKCAFQNNEFHFVLTDVLHFLRTIHSFVLPLHFFGILPVGLPALVMIMNPWRCHPLTGQYCPRLHINVANTSKTPSWSIAFWHYICVYIGALNFIVHSSIPLFVIKFF